MDEKKTPESNRFLTSLPLKIYEAIKALTEYVVESDGVYREMARFEVREPLNRVAPQFFATAHRCLNGMAFVLIRDLTGTAQSQARGKKRLNTSLRGLLTAAYGSEADAPAELIELADRAHRATNVPEWASRVIAHNDVETMLEIEPLPPVLRGDVGVVGKLLRQFVNLFETRWGIERTQWREPILVKQVGNLVAVLNREL